MRTTSDDHPGQICLAMENSRGGAYLADYERSQSASCGDNPPRAGDLLRESGLALAIPLLLGLVATFGLATGGLLGP